VTTPGLGLADVLVGDADGVGAGGSSRLDGEPVELGPGLGLGVAVGVGLGVGDGAGVELDGAVEEGAGLDAGVDELGVGGLGASAVGAPCAAGAKPVSTRPARPIAPTTILRVFMLPPPSHAPCLCTTPRMRKRDRARFGKRPYAGYGHSASPASPRFAQRPLPARVALSVAPDVHDAPSAGP
jgi:hypothetical protein